MPKTFPLLIAEVANTHGGDQTYLKTLLKKIGETSVDAVKFQIIFADELVSPTHSQYSLFKSLEFSKKTWQESVRLIRKHDKQVVMDIFGKKSLEIAKLLKPDFIKIHATDLNNLPLIKDVLTLSRPVFFGTGGATEKEIDTVMDLAKNHSVCLQTGFQAYPTPIEETHLNRVEFLKNTYKCSIGFADHVDGSSLFAKILPCLAITKGACSIEKHIRLSDLKTKYDWEAALPVEEFTELRNQLQSTLLSLGNKDFTLTKKEKEYRMKVRRHLVCLADYKKGGKLNVKDIGYLRAELNGKGTPLQIEEFEKYQSLSLKKDIKKYTVLTKELFQ
jgi:sialic acid synthase SpsE